MNNNNHVYTYIHTYMEERKKKEDSVNTNVIFYDGEYLKRLKEIAFRNDTNVSSIVSNLVREFVLLSETETPQRTLFNFEEKQTVDFFDNEWDTYIRYSSKEEKEKIKNQIINIDKILGRYY